MKAFLTVWKQGAATMGAVIGAGIALDVIMEKVVKVSVETPWAYQIPTFASGTNLVWQIGTVLVVVPVFVGYLHKLIAKKVR